MSDGEKIPKRIEKRDGRVVEFDQSKITKAVESTTEAVGTGDTVSPEKISNRVVEKLIARNGEKIPHVEEVQDLVEETLIERNHAKTAKAYILYRKQHELHREAESTFVEVKNLIDDYLGQSDWRVNENSNVSYSFPGLYRHAAGSVVENYTLSEVYPAEISRAHKEGKFHIHDLSFGIAAYCSGWSLQDLLFEGFNGVSGKVASGPAKHFDTALLQMANFMGTLQNEWAGAQAFNSMDTLLAPFVRSDGLDYRGVKQGIQKLIFNLNVTSRWGNQSPFTNLTMDWTVPEDLKDQPVVIGGDPQNSVYSEYREEMDMINRAFLEVLMEGDYNGRPFTFPIPTYNITDKFNWDSENADLLFELTAKYGLPYFSNFVSSDMDASDIRSMCCRLQLGTDKLEKNVTGGLFGSSDKTGSQGVVTMNMPRLGYLSRNQDDFIERLNRLMNLAKKSLEIKRDLVSRNLQNDLLPFSKKFLGSLENHFSTIGLVGMNEACLNLFGENIASGTGREFTVEILEHMRDKLREFQEETGNLYNLEASPAEGTSYRLARIDKEKYPDIIAAGEDEPYYTNSTQIPVDLTDDLFRQVEIEEDFQKLYTGGTVFHTYLGEKMSGNAAKMLIKRLTHKSELPYVTLTPTYSICPDHGHIPGEHPKCPDCEKETEVYSRVVGYYRPVQNWNEGKREEFDEREDFEVSQD